MRSPASPGARRAAAAWTWTHLLRICLALLPASAAAWGPAGHRAVGAVADDLVAPATRAAVEALLADDRDRDGRPSGRRRLAQVADWADEIRGLPGDHPHWHYDNQPVCGGPAPRGQWCPGGDCASAAIEAQLAILADAHRPREERAVALKWVVHLAGDLHQPLHVADLAAGGNRIRVAPPGGRGGTERREESLHAFWDNHLVNLALHAGQGEVPARSLRALERRARALAPADVAAPPARWAEESHALARELALRIDGVDCRLAGPGEGIEVALDDAYVAKARRVVEQRLALAGARLAATLDRALGN
jgi:hypothetical protein